MPLKQCGRDLTDIASLLVTFPGLKGVTRGGSTGPWGVVRLPDSLLVGAQDMTRTLIVWVCEWEKADRPLTTACFCHKLLRQFQVVGRGARVSGSS